MTRFDVKTPTDFWSRRRQAVAAEEQAQRHAEVEASSAEYAAALSDKPDAEILDALNLPDPEKMERGDDFAAFMAREVPAHLRKAALRQLWRSDPVLANLDGLVDYGQDFTDAALETGKLATAYQVGKGMAAHVETLVENADPSEELDAAKPDPATDPAPELSEVADEPEQASEPEATQTVEVEEPQFHTSPAPAPRPRRMSFITTQEQA